MAIGDSADKNWFTRGGKTRAEGYGEEVMEMSAGEAATAAKGPSEAEIRQATATGAAQAGAVSQAGAMEAAQGLMGAGTGAVSPGRAQALMAQSQKAAQEGTAKAGASAREVLNQVAQRKKESALATLQQEQQFARQMRAQKIQQTVQLGGIALKLFGL